MSASWVDPEAGGAAASSTSWAAETGDTKPTTDDSNWQDNGSSNNASEKPEKRGRCLMWVKLAISIIFVVLFVISASLEFNDTARVIMWFIFYLLHAILAMLGVIRPFCCTQLLGKPILLISLAMFVWSVILMGIAAYDLAKAEKGGPTEGGDANNATNREEIGFELGGALLGVLSTIYHIVLVQCCDKKDD